jgi:hypothetical protein
MQFIVGRAKRGRFAYCAEETPRSQFCEKRLRIYYKFVGEVDCLIIGLVWSLSYGENPCGSN